MCQIISDILLPSAKMVYHLIQNESQSLASHCLGEPQGLACFPTQLIFLSFFHCASTAWTSDASHLAEVKVTFNSFVLAVSDVRRLVSKIVSLSQMASNFSRSLPGPHCLSQYQQHHFLSFNLSCVSAHTSTFETFFCWCCLCKSCIFKCRIPRMRRICSLH